MKKYGLQLRVPVSQKKQNPTRPPLPPAPGFGDDDENDVEAEIARQAYKNKALKDVEEQQKKALEEDPSVFDYDGVYDEMKQKIAQPLMKDRQERKSKYIEKLMAKAKERERDHEIVYEKKLAKERSKDDHLYAEKEKFVTSAYKKKLAEQAKWLEEERLRQLREEREDVTKKEDLSDFYFNLSKNVAFGGGRKDREKPLREAEVAVSDDKVKQGLPAITDQQFTNEPSQVGGDHDEPKSLQDVKNVQDEAGISTNSQQKFESSDSKSTSVSTSMEGNNPETEYPAVAEQKKEDRHKLNEDALTAAKERYLARKKAKLL
ncbi:hypothetical protein H6P81_010502 [Aristolochia fimbriata]|uniref:Nuclear speckle splicing regulatory protein 1 N-terminal domain-containing protein n=1 Tax=Aristolochia fimbriata TaxID=158543 RepID=A0AAV7ESC4_ARIFI|nr:hypothetical protein H6P81_010502 [Aristolochia fimbriata]